LGVDWWRTRRWSGSVVGLDTVTAHGQARRRHSSRMASCTSSADAAAGGG